MNKQGFSLIEMMVAAMFVSIALVGLVGAIVWDTINVSVQDQKNKAVHIANIIMEEMSQMSLEDIINTNWDLWVKSNGYDYGLDSLYISADFPLVYTAERNGFAYQHGHTYRNGFIWAGFRHPEFLKSVLEVDLVISWKLKGSDLSYSVSTIFSEIKREG